MKLNKKSNKNIFFSNEEGFTLLELLVTIGIMAALIGMFSANYVDTNKSTQLVFASENLISDIRLTEGYGLGLLKYEDQVPAGGWGINFNEGDSFYTIFADLDESHAKDPGEEFKKVNFPKGTTIDSIVVSPQDSSLDITFLPPDPVVYVNNDYNKSAQIILKNQKNETKTIEVNFFGLVDALD